MKDTSVSALEERARELRKLAVTMIYEAGSGHPGGSLSAADLVAALYFHEMNHDPQRPKWPERDRFVLSKGHVAPIMYAALAVQGYVPIETIHRLRKKGSPFQGHPDSKKCPGVEISTGSLGQGVSAAVGMALAAKRDGLDYRVFTLLGDGEIQEGQVWEALQCAATYRLDNLIVIVDRNNLQIDGTTDEISPNRDIALKLAAWGFDTAEIDGHDMTAILAALDEFRGKSSNGMPKGLVIDTIKGKGVSYMENQLDWHGLAPNKEQYEQAMKELEHAK
jgi:transketolase